jgi:site-specific recombinase XerD
MLLKTLVQPYLTFCKAERNNADQTLEKYKECFRTWIVPQLGNKDVEAINRLETLGLRQVMVAKSLSIARQYGVLIVLKSFLKFCNHVLKLDVIDPTEIPLPNRGRPKVVALTNTEVETLVSNINTNTFAGARLRALIELLLGTGLRISEALGLNRDIIDAGVTDTEIIGKGGKLRTIFLNKRCIFWMKHYLSKRFDDSEALFVTTGLPARRLGRSDISRFFIHLRCRAEVKKKVTPHILRHTFCTNLLNHGADVTFIRDLAGHQDIQTTAKYYLGVNKEQLRKIAANYLDYGVEQQAADNNDFSTP